MYNTKNYTEQGGEKTVIGGTLEIASGGKVEGLPLATETVSGGVKATTKGAGDTVEVKIDGTSGKMYVPTYAKAANQAASTEATSPTVIEFNALLTKLKAAGLMVADA
jgi:hypothetical protein